MPAGTISPCQLPKLQKIGEKLMQSTAARLCSPALAVAPTRAYLWLVQVVAHGQVAQSAALSGRIDARRDDFAVPTVKSAQGRV
jgi:hypothetical protein